MHIRALRFRLFSIFSASIATTLASLAHAVLVMTSPGFWEGIFGAATLLPSIISHALLDSRLTVHGPLSYSTGCVEVAVSIIVCNMSLIIPAVLRALGVGDPFMQEDTVDLDLSAGVDIARMYPARVEVGLPTFRGTGITDSDEGGIGTIVHQQRGSIDLGAKDDQKHQLTTQASDASLGDMRVTPLADESKIADSLVRVSSLPTVRKDQGIEVCIEEKVPKRNSA